MLRRVLLPNPTRVRRDTRVWTSSNASIKEERTTVRETSAVTARRVANSLFPLRPILPLRIPLLPDQAGTERHATRTMIVKISHIIAYRASVLFCVPITVAIKQRIRARH